MKKTLLFIIGTILIMGYLNRPTNETKTVSIGGVAKASQNDEDSISQAVSTQYVTTSDTSMIIFESTEYKGDEGDREHPRIER